MPIVNRIAEFHDEITAWRRDLHAHPETAFAERRTADMVAGKLADFLILDRDYLSIPVDEIRAIRPLMTVVGGRVVYARE